VQNTQICPAHLSNRRRPFLVHAKSPTHALTANPVIDRFGWNADL
jgi:hypothetical protein